MAINNKQNEDKSMKKLKRKNTITAVLWMLGCIALLILVIFLVGYIYVWIDDGMGENIDAIANPVVEEGQETVVTYTQEELDAYIATAAEEARTIATQQEANRILGGIKDNLNDSKTVVETLRLFYPEEVVLASQGKYWFIPIDENLSKNNYLQENLVINEKGEYEYWENERIVSHKGVDVSKHQGEINWQKVAADGVEFAFIRVGYRAYGTGVVYLDEFFDENMKGALSNGIKVGVYFYSQAITQEEAQEEAAFVIEKIAPYKFDGPVVFDTERVVDSAGRANSLTMEERTTITKVFCDKIVEAKYEPMIYHNLEVGMRFLDLSQLDKYEKWYAYYGENFYFPYEYSIWQYTEEGSVNGIRGGVDLNIAFKIWGE